MKKSLINMSTFSYLLVLSATALADSQALKGSDKKIADLLSTYSQGCQNESFLTNLEMLFRKSELNQPKHCDQRELNDNVTSILSKANDEKTSDSDYREWYGLSESRLRLVVNPVQLKLMQPFQGIKKRVTGSNIINDQDKPSERGIPTVKGYKTLGGN